MEKNKKKNKLWKLIKSLSKGERRSIMNAVKYHKEGKSNIIRLYEAIEQQNEYDENALKKRFKGSKMVKHFASQKVHLYDFIMRSLADYHQNLSPRTLAFDLLKRAEILYNKGFYSACLQLLAKTKKIAHNYSLLIISYEVVNMQINFASLRPSANDETELQYLIEERAYIIKQLDNLSNYQLISNEIYIIHRQLYGSTSEEIKKNLEHLMAHPLLQDESEAISYQSRKSFYYIHFLYNAIINRPDLSNKYLKKRLQWIETKPFLLKKEMRSYIVNLVNLARSYAQINDIEEFKTTLNKLKTLPEKYPSFFNVTLKKLLLTKTLLLESTLCIATLNFERVDKVTLQVEKYILSNEGNYDIGDVFYIYCHMANIKFYQEQYANTIDWCNRTLSITKTNHLAEERIAISIYNILSHYELGNNELLEYLVQQTMRYMNKMQKDNSFKRTIFNFIKTQLKNKEVNKREFQKCRDKLIHIQSQTSTNLLPSFDIVSWLNSKIEEKSFLECFKETNMR